ncbi:MAG: CotH kinase family protein, partial [Bacteroidota bacterium]|nr:CotH kinase family protein [Bacteroidota bacterium]
MKSILTSLLCLLTFSISAQALTQFSNLPTCYITTEGGADITSKEVYIPGAISIVSRDTTEKLSNEVIQIRGRGNSTWTSMPKKSYRIKFEKKRKLLGSPNEAKNWVLLANYADKTMIRNAVAFEISRFMGMAFTPYSRFVDVVLNGDYIGTYQVTDQVEVNPGRVDVEKQDSAMTTEPDISGGYLLEVDGFASGEQVWFKTANGMPVTVKYPDDEDINDQ